MRLIDADKLADKLKRLKERIDEISINREANCLVDVTQVIEYVENAPTVEAVRLDESCDDCPLYDHDKHNCPRFNKVIPRTIAEARQGYTEWLEKIIVEAETIVWPCEDTNDKEWCENNCHYSSIQAECLRHLYEVSKGGDDE